MKKSVLRVVLWVFTIGLSTTVIFTQRERVIVQELINAEVYLTTEQIKSGENYKWTFTTSNRNLSGIEVAFVYGETEEKDYPALIEVFCDDNIVAREELNLVNCPNGSFYQLEIPEIIEQDGMPITIRITNLSKKDADTRFSLLYTDNEYRYLDNVEQYCLNDIEMEGQLISRYTYETSYEYYRALTIVFEIVLLIVVLDGFLKQPKKCV